MRHRYPSRRTRRHHWRQRSPIQGMGIPPRPGQPAAVHRHRRSRSFSTRLYRGSRARMCKLTLPVRVPVIRTLLNKTMRLQPIRMEAVVTFSRLLTLLLHGSTVDMGRSISNSTCRTSRFSTSIRGRNRCLQPTGHSLPNRMRLQPRMAMTTLKTTSCNTLIHRPSIPLSMLSLCLPHLARLCHIYLRRGRRCLC